MVWIVFLSPSKLYNPPFYALALFAGLLPVSLQSAQFYKVTTENFHKAADEVNAKYK